MRNKIMIIALMLAVMAAMTGIGSAYEIDSDGFTCQQSNPNNNNPEECIKASFDNTNTKIDAQAKAMVADKCYQIRYYQPTTLKDGFTEDDLYPKLSTGLQPYSVSNSFGYFLGEKFFDDPHSESLDNPPVPTWKQGVWKVLLMKGGKDSSGGCTDATTILTSLMVYVSVNIPIPEFATIAMPIAAVLGLVFFFQQRKKKEE